MHYFVHFTVFKTEFLYFIFEGSNQPPNQSPKQSHNIRKLLLLNK
jgi:hypothetical protein